MRAQLIFPVVHTLWQTETWRRTHTHPWWRNLRTVTVGETKGPAGLKSCMTVGNARSLGKGQRQEMCNDPAAPQSLRAPGTRQPGVPSAPAAAGDPLKATPALCEGIVRGMGCLLVISMIAWAAPSRKNVPRVAKSQSLKCFIASLRCRLWHCLCASFDLSVQSS